MNELVARAFLTLAGVRSRFRDAESREQLLRLAAYSEITAPDPA